MIHWQLVEAHFLEHNVGYGIGVVCFLLVGILWDGCRSEAGNTGSYLTPADDANLQCMYSVAKIVVINAGWKA